MWKKIKNKIEVESNYIIMDISKVISISKSIIYKIKNLKNISAGAIVDILLFPIIIPNPHYQFPRITN